MKRTNIHLTDRQREMLKRQSEKTGLTSAELVRWAVDEFLESMIRMEMKPHSKRKRRHKAV